MTSWPPLSSRVLKLPKIHFEIAIYEPNELMNLADKFGLPLTHYLLFFAVLLVAFGWSGIIPAIHLTSMYGVQLVMRLVALDWMGLMSFLYTASAVTYATRIPERFFPGKCDIWVSKYN